MTVFPFRINIIASQLEPTFQIASGHVAEFQGRSLDHDTVILPRVLFGEFFDEQGNLTGGFSAVQSLVLTRSYPTGARNIQQVF